ncbi:MAG: hypothetical protein ACD_71C00239G0005, partial [uncultured bacterium (gcode 4)]
LSWKRNRLEIIWVLHQNKCNKYIVTFVLMKSTFYTPSEARAHARETVKKWKILLATEIEMEL